MRTDQPRTDQGCRQASCTSTVEVAQQASEIDMDTEFDSESGLRPCFTGQAEEGELSYPDQDVSVTDADQALSEEQNYRETMSGICSYMGWTDIDCYFPC